MSKTGGDPTTPLTYRDAGVDIDAGDALVERIKPRVARTMRPEVLAGMQQVAGRMSQFFSEKKFNLLLQGGGATRGKLLDQFKSTPRSVLFGTDSFWMGVDVPGEALSNVIITRLPFAVPDHPLIEAKLELIEQRGGDPFTEYSLPEAILKLRQGVGRLIRTKTDHGIIVILDNRVVTKPYGRAFMQALPKCPVEIL